MANQKLNEVTTVPTVSINNVKTFLVVMNDNSIQQMSKEDMATVLGGLLLINDTWFRNRGVTGDNFDFNEAKAGVYTVNSRECTNQPVPKIGTLIHAGTQYGAQLFFTIIDNEFYYRSKDNTPSSWTAWKKVTSTSV